MRLTTAHRDDPRIARCVACGYQLQGLPTPRCPECGAAFDPADPRTMSFGPAANVILSRRWLGPTGSWATWGLWLVTAVALLIGIAALPWPIVLLASMFPWLALGIVLWLRTQLRGWAAAIYQVGGEARGADAALRRRVRRRFVVVSLIVAMHVPLYIVFSVQLRSFDRLQHQVMDNAASPLTLRRVGIYHASPVDACPHGFKVLLGDEGWLGVLVYDPTDAHCENLNGHGAWLGGGWYIAG